MIRHIVLFKFKADVPETTKNEKLAQIKSGLENLMGPIKQLKKIEVGINGNPIEKYDLSLIADFDSMEGLDTYSTHPEHLKIGVLIREILESRACVDYEY
jgi:hypothetical protein